jgi:hypothetical protein
MALGVVVNPTTNPSGTAHGDTNPPTQNPVRCA